MRPDAALPVRGAALLMALTAALLLLRQGHVPLVGPDEPRYARVAIEMSRSGDLVTPTLQGQPWLEKPALYYWMAAAAFRALGETEMAARVPALLAALLMTGATAIAGARLYGGAAGLHAGFVTGTCLLIFMYGRAASMDMLLAATVTTSIAFLGLAALGIAGRLAVPAAFVFAALATLAKGPLGALLPALAVGGYILAARDWRLLRRIASPLNWILFLLVAAPWYVLVTLAQGLAFVDTFFLDHNVQRFTSTVHRHPGPVVYYLPVLLIGLFPWSGLVIPALTLVHPRASRADLFVLSWLVLPLLFFSLAGSKLPGYILPCLPPLALWIGRAADRMVKGAAVAGTRAAGVVTVTLAALVGAGLIAASRADERAWPLLMPVAAWCVLTALLFSSLIRRAPDQALRAMRVGAAGLLVLLTSAAPPILRARESGRDLFLPARGRDVLAWGAWRTAWMAGYFYNDGRVRQVEGIGEIQRRLAAGPVLVLCGPGECRSLEHSPGLRTRVLAKGPRGNALLRVELAGLGVHPLHHLHGGPAPRRERVRDLVHELPHEEDAAAVRLQQVLFRERVGDGGGIEPFPLVLDLHLERVRRGGEDDADALALVPAIAVLDRIDYRLAHGDAQVMRGIVVEPRLLGGAGEDGLHHLDHLEAARDVELDGPDAGRLHRAPRGAAW